MNSFIKKSGVLFAFLIFASALIFSSCKKKEPVSVETPIATVFYTSAPEPTVEISETPVSSETPGRSSEPEITVEPAYTPAPTEFKPIEVVIPDKVEFSSWFEKHGVENSVQILEKNVSPTGRNCIVIEITADDTKIQELYQDLKPISDEFTKMNSMDGSMSFFKKLLENGSYSALNWDYQLKLTVPETVVPTLPPETASSAAPVVTLVPTLKPTATPTVKPTATPTVKPTATPSNPGEYTEVPYGLDITNKTDLVGICYTIWFNQIFGSSSRPITNVLNVEEMTAKYGFNSRVGFGAGHNSVNSFHFWSEPAQGYYRSTDINAAKKNMKMIAEAGVDYIIVDMTYASANGGWAYPSDTWTRHIYNPCVTLLNAITELRAQGQKAPYVVFWPNNDSMFAGIRTQLLNVSEWKDCFVYWDGNPLILTWNYDGVKTYKGLTVKGMNGLSGSKADYQWSYLEVNNLNAYSPTHMPVCVACQRNYMSNTSQAVGRNGGKTWYNQWKNAFEKHPKLVTVTWWNEWAAQLLDNSMTGIGYQFTDNFNMEYSRDIEPMKGGHGSLYYDWLCSYVKAYKSHEPCPRNFNS